MAEIRFRRTHARSGSAETDQFRVAHLAEARSQRLELEWLESYGTHECYPSHRRLNIFRASVGYQLSKCFALENYRLIAAFNAPSLVIRSSK
jgi:hypothetical protein